MIWIEMEHVVFFGWNHASNRGASTRQQTHNNNWSPTVPVSVWLPEPARDRGSKQETLNDDFVGYIHLYHRVV